MPHGGVLHPADVLDVVDVIVRVDRVGRDVELVLVRGGRHGGFVAHHRPHRAGLGTIRRAPGGRILMSIGKSLGRQVVIAALVGSMYTAGCVRTVTYRAARFEPADTATVP